MVKFNHILLIDDDEDNQEIFLTAVKEIGISAQCTALSSATLALEKLRSKTLSTDIIFLDLNMPVMCGQQFLMHIKKDPELSGIPVIIFSTSSQAKTIQLMKEMGADEFITKPDRYDKLLNMLTPILS